MCILANMYDDGNGVAKDPIEAVKLLRMAVDLGDVSSMFNLAFTYNSGNCD